MSDEPIYLDHQASTPLEDSVLEAMLPYFQGKFGNPHSTHHSFGWDASTAINEAAEAVADLVGGNASEVIFTSGATEANNHLILGLHPSTPSRRKIVLSAGEHPCVVEAASEKAAQTGIEVVFARLNRNGFVDTDELANIIDDTTLMASIMWVNNEVGSINNIQEISDICRKNGVIFHSDISQAPMAVDCSDAMVFCDAVSISGHKIGGPKGIGALVANETVTQALKPIIFGGGQQRMRRSGTLPTPLCVGLGQACKIVSDPAFTDARNRTRELSDLLWTALCQNDLDLLLNGPPIGPNRHPGNLNVCFRGIEAEDLLFRVSSKIAASTGSACSSGTTKVSHVLNAMGIDDAHANGSVRLSVGQHSSKEEVKYAAHLLSEAHRGIMSSE